jgi:hypothetical protein
MVNLIIFNLMFNKISDHLASHEIKFTISSSPLQLKKNRPIAAPKNGPGNLPTAPDVSGGVWQKPLPLRR